MDLKLCDYLQKNTCLKKLNIAWNGFYLDGCTALARALEVNKTLTELDLTCNRVSKECLEKLMGGLKKNSTLEILRVCSEALLTINFRVNKLIFKTPSIN